MVKIHLSNQELLAGKLSLENWQFSYFPKKSFVVGTHKKCLVEAHLMSTHNIIIIIFFFFFFFFFFFWDISKIYIS